MLNVPKILVCTDFSPESRNALIVAEKIRKKAGGQITLLHVSEHTAMWDWISSEGLPSEPDARFEVDLLNTFRKKISEELENTGIEGRAEVIIGVASSVIIQEIEQQKIDLVVIGHRGRSQTIFHLGSLAQKIIASSPVPVLVAKKSSLSNVAGLVDPTENMQQIVNWSEELSNLLSCQLAMISVIPDFAAQFLGIGKVGISTALLQLKPDDRIALIKATSEKIKKELDPHTKARIRVEVSPEKKISYHLNSILEDEKIDLVIMRRHQAELLEKILIGSETRRMLEIFHGNLLILPPSQRR